MRISEEENPKLGDPEPCHGPALQGSQLGLPHPSKSEVQKGLDPRQGYDS